MLIVMRKLVNNQRLGKSVRYELTQRCCKNMIEVWTGYSSITETADSPGRRRNESQPKTTLQRHEERGRQFFIQYKRFSSRKVGGANKGLGEAPKKLHAEGA